MIGLKYLSLSLFMSHLQFLTFDWCADHRIHMRSCVGNQLLAFCVMGKFPRIIYPRPADSHIQHG